MQGARAKGVRRYFQAIATRGPRRFEKRICGVRAKQIARLAAFLPGVLEAGSNPTHRHQQKMLPSLPLGICQVRGSPQHP